MPGVPGDHDVRVSGSAELIRDHLDWCPALGNGFWEADYSMVENKTQSPQVFSFLYSWGPKSSPLLRDRWVMTSGELLIRESVDLRQSGPQTSLLVPLRHLAGP